MCLSLATCTLPTSSAFIPSSSFRSELVILYLPLLFPLQHSPIPLYQLRRLTYEYHYFRLYLSCRITAPHPAFDVIHPCCGTLGSAFGFCRGCITCPCSTFGAVIQAVPKAILKSRAMSSALFSDGPIERPSIQPSILIVLYVLRQEGGYRTLFSCHFRHFQGLLHG